MFIYRHGSTFYQGKLWISGGAPLNNEVWHLSKVTRIGLPPSPSSRSMKATIQYKMEWTQHTNAAWSPRAGMAFLSHWYFDYNQTNYNASIERLVVIGGFGGWSNDTELFDGLRGRSDVWTSTDGDSWTLMLDNAPFGPRAWFGYSQVQTSDPRLDISSSTTNSSLLKLNKPPRLFLFGGGDLGTSPDTNRRSVSGYDYFLSCIL